MIIDINTKRDDGSAMLDDQGLAVVINDIRDVLAAYDVCLLEASVLVTQLLYDIFEEQDGRQMRRMIMDWLGENQRPRLRHPKLKLVIAPAHRL